MWCQGPSCRPARASLITARYPYQQGSVGPDAPANDPAWPTVMKRLQSAGYATATFGKTDCGFKDKSRSEVPEGNRGRDAGPESATGRDVREMHPFIRSFGWEYASENPSQIDIALPGYTPSYTDYLRARGLYDVYCPSGARALARQRSSSTPASPARSIRSTTSRLDLGALQLGSRRADGGSRSVRQDALLPGLGRRALHRAAAAHAKRVAEMQSDLIEPHLAGTAL
jgi:hypothetical protein